MKHIKELIEDLQLSVACLMDEPTESEQQDLSDKLEDANNRQAIADTLAAGGLGSDF
jgi:hypothetical protein